MVWSSCGQGVWGASSTKATITSFEELRDKGVSGKKYVYVIYISYKA